MNERQGCAAPVGKNMSKTTLSQALLGSCALIALSAPAIAQSAAEPETVVVTASRYHEEARIQQKNAINIVDIQPAEEIIKYPDFNAAESAARMPGITLMSDTGEGRFVMIRGIDPNLNGTTYGGVVLLNTDPGGTYQGGGGRAVELDTIPGGAIDGIIVTKTLTPDHEAEGLGGTIEFTPRTAMNITTPFADISLGAGYEPIHGRGGPFTGDIAVGARFGFDNGLVVEHGQSAGKVNPGFVSNPTPFSFVVSASWREDRRAFDDIEEDYIGLEDGYVTNPTKTASASDKLWDDVQLRKYDAHRKRFAVGGEFDFKPNDDHRWYFRGNMFGYDEQINKNHLIFNNLYGNTDGGYDNTYPIAISGNQVSTQSDITMKGTNSQTIARNNVFVLGGQDDFHAFQIDYRAAYSRATNAADRSFGSSVNGPEGVHVTYDNIDNPNFPTIKVTDGTDLNDPSLYTLKKLKDGTEKDADEEWSYAGNVNVPVNILSSDDRLKFGFSTRLRVKSGTPNNDQSVSVPKGTLLSSLSPLPADTHYYHDRYTNGPGINQGVLFANVQDGTWAIDPVTVDDQNVWRGDENIYAGYGMYTGDYGSWEFMAGARVEATVAKYSFVDDQVGPVIMRKNYTDIFPSAQVRYQISPDMLVRGSYSTGIGRPGFTQVTGNSHVDITTWYISTGNPELKPITGNNFDLDFEWYLNDSGIFEVGAFDKEFQNYIFQRELIVNSDPRAVALGWVPTDGNIHLDTYGNIPSAYARGLEIAYQQKFTFLPRPFDGFGFDGNYTVVTSSGAARPGDEHALPGTAPTTFNAAIFYEQYGLNLRIAASYYGHSLYEVGGSRSQDQFEDSRFQVDWTSSYDIFDNASVYFNVKNINNAPLRIFLGAPNWVIQREFYDQTFETGVRIKLGE